MAVREAWTDERLDDLSRNMGREFDRVHVDLREVRDEVRSMRGEMAAMQRSMIVGQRTILIGFGGLVASVLATQL